MSNENIDLNRLLSNEQIDSQWLSLDFKSWTEPQNPPPPPALMIPPPPPPPPALMIPPPPPPPPASMIPPPPPSISFRAFYPQDPPTIPYELEQPNAAVINGGPSNTPPPPPAPAPVFQSYSSRARKTSQICHDAVPSPFPWATDRRATVHDLGYLLANGISNIKGEVQCRRCEHKDRISLDLQSKFAELRAFILSEYHAMHDRATARWMNPTFADCGACRQPNCLKPVIADKKRNINWLFLFLGQTLGCCTLEQLKYFCKHTQNHRTGAKDRVLFNTYIAIAKQLDPEISSYLKKD